MNPVHGQGPRSRTGLILALSLFVFGVFADDHDFSFSLNDLAFFADRFYGWFYFHNDTIPFVGNGLFAAPGDSSACRIVGADLHRHLVTRQNSDEIHTKFSRDMS